MTTTFLDRWRLPLAARSDESLAEVAQECTEQGAASVLVMPTDVGDDDAVAALVERTVADHGRLDAVVNAAGVVAYGPAEEVPREVFDRVLRTNLAAPGLGTHALGVSRPSGSRATPLNGSPSFLTLIRCPVRSSRFCQSPSGRWN